MIISFALYKRPQFLSYIAIVTILILLGSRGQTAFFRFISFSATTSKTEKSDRPRETKCYSFNKPLFYSCSYRPLTVLFTVAGRRSLLALAISFEITRRSKPPFYRPLTMLFTKSLALLRQLFKTDLLAISTFNFLDSIKIWNQLPISLVNCNDFEMFKLQLTVLKVANIT